MGHEPSKLYDWKKYRAKTKDEIKEQIKKMNEYTSENILPDGSVFLFVAGPQTEKLFSTTHDIYKWSIVWRSIIDVDVFKCHQVNDEARRTLVPLHVHLNFNQWSLLYCMVHECKINCKKYHFKSKERSSLDNMIDKNLTERHNTNTNTRKGNTPQEPSESEECVVCMDQTVSIVLPCAHAFCQRCIDEWKKQSDTCPYCRHKDSNDSEFFLTDATTDSLHTDFAKDFETLLQYAKNALL